MTGQEEKAMFRQRSGSWKRSGLGLSDIFVQNKKFILRKPVNSLKMNFLAIYENATESIFHINLESGW